MTGEIKYNAIGRLRWRPMLKDDDGRIVHLGPKCETKSEAQAWLDDAKRLRLGYR